MTSPRYCKRGWRRRCRDQSIDIVTCTFALHHFDQAGAARLLREMARVARLGVIVTDLRRSYGGYWGARLLALGPVNRLSRHDGPLSVLRAYTVAEAQALVETAGVPARVRAEPAFRLTLSVGPERGSAASPLHQSSAEVSRSSIMYAD